MSVGVKKGIYKNSVYLLGVFFMISVVSGCASIPSIGGGGSKKGKVIKINRSEYDALIAEKEALQKKLKEVSLQLEEAKKEEAGKKAIVLFGGKITYEVTANAVMDYEEALVFKQLNDPDFKAAMDNGGQGADMALITVLKQMSPDDRRITRKELKGFRKQVLGIK